MSSMDLSFDPYLDRSSFPGDLLGERTRLIPEKIALVEVATQRRWTYAELNERAVRCALLMRRYAAKGDRVAILSQNRIEYSDVFWGAAKSGITLVPLNTRLTPIELEQILNDSGAKMVLYDREDEETIKTLKARMKLDYWVALDETPESSDIGYQEVYKRVNPENWSPEPLDLEELHCLLYTSGTTGKPKGVMIPHRMVLWNAYNTALSWQLRSDDVAPIFTPLFHAGGLSVFLTPVIAIGGTVVLHRRFDAVEVWKVMQEEGCTLLFGVPTIFRMLLEALESNTVDLRRVRWMISGGAPLPLELVEAYRKHGVLLKQGYGLTEVGVNCFAISEADSSDRPASVGRPLLFTEAKLLNSHGALVARGEVGELVLRGPHVCKGYWHNEEATAQVLDQGGWFKTGDLARCDDRGLYYIVGRCKEMFITGGENVYPAEIEEVLLLHPAIRDAAVIGVPHPKWGEVGIAFVAGKEDRGMDVEEVLEFLGGRIARYKLPHKILVLDNIPRTAYGKIIRGELMRHL
jgi:fatty-acyl-CoA synthase